MTFERGFNVSLNDLPVLKDTSHEYQDLFPCSKYTHCTRSSKRIRQRDNNLSRYLSNDLIRSWMKSPKMIPKSGVLTLNVIVESSDGTPLPQSVAKVVSSAYQSRFNCGSISSANDYSNVNQVFHHLSKLQLQNLQEEQDRLGGFSISADGDVDIILSRYNHGEVSSLISTDKVFGVTKPSSPNGYNQFVRVFAGVAPKPRSDWHVSRDIPNLKISYGYSSARAHTEYSPLSTCFFQSTFHRHEYNHEVLDRVEKSFGNSSRGLFETRSCMKSIGSCSYLGPRKSKVENLNRPNVSEGPREKSRDRSENRWWHRKKINHAYWPYTLSLMNVMIGPATLAAYYVYTHMSKLYDVCNSTTSMCKFCPSVIMTIDFSCSCHVDRNDKEEKTTTSMIERLRSIINEMNVLKSNNVPFAQQREAEALCSLKHLSYWGFCVPTTCCYQYIFKGKDAAERKIRIYQWFMCPGLGTVHLIRNYWVHMMLAGLFSHCTSVPIYIVDDRTVYFGKCPYVTMFAWGGL